MYINMRGCALVSHVLIKITIFLYKSLSNNNYNISIQVAHSKMFELQWFIGADSNVKFRNYCSIHCGKYCHHLIKTYVF